MEETNRGISHQRGATLRLGEITVAMSVAIATGLGVGMAALAMDAVWLSPPPLEIGTVEGARILLGSVTGGVITVAVFGLWVRTVVVGIMSANFSPRTLLIFLDDRFQRNLLACMSAGVVASMVILLGMPSDEQAAAPLISTILAVLIALAALVGVLLAIQHATRSLALPELVSRLAEDVLRVLERHPKARVKLTRVPPPLSEPITVLAPGTGWITGIDTDRMRKALPVGGIVHLRCRFGEFVTPRRCIALVCLAEADTKADLSAVAESVKLARTRSPDMDLVFAVSLLVDVGTFALEARSDTSTAHEVMVHLEFVLAEIIFRGLPRLHDEDTDGRRVYDESGWDAVDLVKLCTERLRESAARDPERARHLIQMLHRIREVAEDCEETAVISEVESQVEMVLALATTNNMLSRERQRLEREAKAVVRGNSASSSAQSK
ncbi:DUF2254 family protein [Lacimicrobium alkaliphilum]|uniref:DUF2254 domain-containing protein n=1 Tax=Lacimicrobium alkaliphilum TaxID=1526571 RepID=A0ABQ1R154_9ALTE|nr:DUF2254 family protein [Lacimicrobium alkaliphilum]GGD54475.1 hypothetical protein GCM10011357_07730 [Lacimicrobium alkaliphilum]